MTFAAIDIGSNTVRMLLATAKDDGLPDYRYFRKVTRLAGDLSAAGLLAPESMARTLDALVCFSDIINRQSPVVVKAVGTAIFRKALNASSLLEQIQQQTGIRVEVIDGATEAALSCRGILSVLQPLPRRALLFDLGGGSTEIILFEDARVCLQVSFPLGVVRLLEDCPSSELRNVIIQQTLAPLLTEPVWLKWQQDGQPIDLVGTAGTVTTLAALKLEMDEYEGRLVNNLVLKRTWLRNLTELLSGLSLEERLALPGMEQGRADLIIPGLQVVENLLDMTRNDSLRVVDAGLLEGILLG